MSNIDVDTDAHRVRVTTPRGVITLTYLGKGRWEWIGTHGTAGVSARLAAHAISDLVPDAPTLLRAAVAGLTPTARSTALEGL